MSTRPNDSLKLTSEDREHLEYILNQWAADVAGEVYDPIDYYYDHGEVSANGKLKHRDFDRIREVKGVESVASLPGHLAVPIMQRVLAGMGMELTDLGYASNEEAIDNLEPLWDRAKMALGEAPLAAAVRMAKAHPLRFTTNRISPKYHMFLNVGYRIQEMRGDEYIVLPVQPLDHYLRCSWKRVGDFRDFAVKEGNLQPLAKHCYVPGGKGLAAKFKFTGEPIEEADS